MFTQRELQLSEQAPGNFGACCFFPARRIQMVSSAAVKSVTIGRPIKRGSWALKPISRALTKERARISPTRSISSMPSGLRACPPLSIKAHRIILQSMSAALSRPRSLVRHFETRRSMSVGQRRWDRRDVSKYDQLDLESRISLHRLRLYQWIRRRHASGSFWNIYLWLEQQSYRQYRARRRGLPFRRPTLIDFKVARMKASGHCSALFCARRNLTTTTALQAFRDKSGCPAPTG